MPAAGKIKKTISPDITAAVRVLETEIEGLQKLSRAIDDNFTNAVTAIHDMKNAGHTGRLIVAGIGKSGHVARKIAATMASTGTPAYYVHPGEASHGDLGMITHHDIVLMFSNSGENSELSDLIHYTRRYSIKLIAVTSNPDSTLAKYSDILLALPKAAEACPNGLAPTTSTTMMLALGDALSVALLNRMGLTKEQYKVFHPGGKLGQRLMKVSELMIPLKDMPLLDSKSKMDKAILVLSEKNLGAVVVVDASKKTQGHRDRRRPETPHVAGTHEKTCHRSHDRVAEIHFARRARGRSIGHDDQGKRTLSYFAARDG